MPPDPDSRRSRLTVRLTSLFLLSAAATALVVLARNHPDQMTVTPLCPWYMATGLRCTGCGMTRALHMLLQAELVEAIRYNPLIVLIPPLSLAAGAYLGFGLLRGRFPAVPEWPRALSWPIVGAIVLQWAYRTVADLLARWAG